MSSTTTIDENNNIIIEDLCLPAQAQAHTAKEQWNQLQHIITTTAASTVGLQCKRHHRFNCSLVAELSAEQRELKLRAYNARSRKKKQELKSQRSQILHQLNKRVKELDRQQLNTQLESIESAKDSAQMFKAARELTKMKKKSNIVIADANNNIIAQDTEAADTIAAHFKKKLNNNNNTISANPICRAATTLRGSLRKPITTAEVTAAAKALQNGRAAQIRTASATQPPCDNLQ